MNEQTDGKRLLPTLTWPRVGLIVFVTVAGFFLWAEHRVHILGALPT